MNIVHLLAPAAIGGLERVVQSLSIGQHQNGHSVSVAVVASGWDDDHPFAQPLLRAGIAIHPIVTRPRSYMQQRRQLAALYHSLQPDIVHSHGYHTDVVFGYLLRKLGAVTVSTAHGFTSGPIRNRLYEFLQRRALRRFDAVISVSQKLVSVLGRAGIPSARTHLIRNAWSSIGTPMDRDEARRTLGLDVRSIVVGWAGRMSFEKGMDIFVDAIALMPHSDDVEFCVIGDGPERAAQQLRASPAVHWTGQVPEAGQYFRAFDVFVISSRSEGVPMAMLEAMSAEVPIVAARVGGIPEVVSSNEVVLVPPESPAALADAIGKVIADPLGAAGRAAAARSHLRRHFSSESWLRQHDAVYATARETCASMTRSSAE